jgi:hypothetical protein
MSSVGGDRHFFSIHEMLTTSSTQSENSRQVAERQELKLR